LNGLEKLEDHSLKNDSGSKQLLFRFLLTPKQIVGDKEGHVSEFVFSRNKLEGPAFQQVSVSDNSSLEESFQTQLVFKSIGYKAEQIIGLPFDLKKSIIPSLNGRVSSGNEDFPGVYVSGWIKRGAHGIIGTNIPDAQETASSISEDWERGLLRRFNDLKFAPAATIKKNAIVDFNGWLKIDQEERNQGVKEGKPREKMTQISNMINASKK
jgi:NADPH-dependent glutamate synthase beta subunit-like oxidoreductase